MSAEPTDGEIQAFATIADVAAWANLIGDPEAQDSALGSLLHRLGAAHTMHYRVVGSMSQLDFE